MKKKSTKYANLIAVCCLAAVVLVFSLMMSIRVVQDYIGDSMRNQEEQLLSLTRSLARNVEIYVETYTQDLLYLAKTNHFQEEEQAYLQNGDTSPLRQAMLRYVLSHNGYIQALYVTDQSSDVVISSEQNGAYQPVPGHHYQQGDVETTLYIDRNNQYFLSLTTHTEKTLQYSLFIKLHRIYDEVLSKVDLGNSASVEILSPDNLILMHDFIEKIGTQAYEVAKEAYPGADYSGQRAASFALRQGQEKVVVFPIYRQDEEGKVETVRQLLSFSPAAIGDRFVQICVEMSYDEMLHPIVFNALKQFFYSFLLLGAIMVLIFASIVIAYRNDRIREENELLRERNETLEKIHENEEKLSHHQRLQMLGTLASGISHEFNNLMTPIMAYSMIFLQDMTPGTEEYEDMQAIYHASERAKELVGQISRLSRKKTDTVFRYLLFDVVVSGAARMVSFGAEREEEQRMEKHLTCGDAGIMGVETQLQQALLNIMLNGLYAMKDSGGVLHISTWKEKSWLAVSIRDEGCGMTEEIKNRIFDPFFTTKGVGEGTGLGLSLVQATVESHGGTVTVDSEVGKGTTFTIRIPFVESPMEPNGMMDGD